jgi:selenocysteine lyase/cysteine desulfurase
VTGLAKTYDVAALRAAEFPWADDAVFLNHASIGPLPDRTRRAMVAYQADRAAAYRLTDRHLNEVLVRSRSLAARLIGADPGEIALATNTSYGLNVAARSLPVAPGDVVVVSQGEFPANVFPWRALEDLGVELELVPLTADGWPDEDRLLERIEDPAVRVLAISMVQFHNGYSADLGRLSEHCRANDTYFVVDAIQGLGQIPFDVKRTPVDILASGAQKWLLSPWGSGFLYVRQELIDQLTPPFAGWTAFRGNEDYRRLTAYDGEWLPDARKFELITLPFQDLLGMNLSVELLLELGIEAIEAHLAELANPVVEWALRRGVRLASPLGARSSGIVAVAPPGIERVFAALTEAGVVASLREGAIRLSPHCYNTVDEMGRVVEILDRRV